ncbi:uncharacterized protein F4812DRAFT_459262 [Daldinia caldariorum]|uniref:uncharacterized protein n=1 Tax=Daldinia caldariorum TaxID=326644 RepID=UPI0020082D83|nr:uncharacterized protein F4812DRAFT_459262 [Daldinia caldariorum]KAI1467980.1 hypothetical protein F4812DRAFT_459262 [Daldinia caldariorum]
MNRLPETNGGIVTSWIPITTAHPHQPGCENFVWKWATNVIAAWDPGYGVSVKTDATCHPKPVTTWWLQDHLGSNRQTVFSLGPVTCPSDYYTATMSAKDASSTYVACCPLEYDFARFKKPGDTGECTSALKKGSVVTYAQRDPDWKITSSSVTADTVVAAIPVNGWTFATPTGSATNSASNCDASVANALANHVATGNASCVGYDGGGISGGAAAGIGVGVSLGVTGLAALGAAIFMMYRTRKPARKRASTSDITPFANSSGREAGKGMDASAHVLPTYPPGRETPSSLPERYPSYERDAWDASTPCLPPPQSSDTHTHARTVPHGEMEGSPYQHIKESATSELGATPSQYTDGRTIGAAGFIQSSHYSSEEETRRRGELEGEFDRNVKVSLSTPWLAAARPVPPSSSESSNYCPPH